MDNWKKQFEESYLRNEFSTAYSLRQSHLPNKLYRYRVCRSSKDLLRRIDEMEGRIHFSKVEELNDPFEACCLCGKQAEIYETHLNNVMVSTMQQEELSDREKLDIIKKSVEALYDDTNKFMQSGLRIACFSTEKNNTALWAHYADQFKGLCFEYCQGEIKKDWLRFLYPVLYKETLPDLMELIRKPSLLYPYVCINKLNFWLYEKEWRVVFDVRDLSRDGLNIDQEVNSYFCKPKRVLIGSNMDRKLKEVITKSAKSLGIAPVLMLPTPRGLSEQEL